MWMTTNPGHTVAETRIFTKQSSQILGEEEKDELIDHISQNPMDGVLVPGLGGIRKLRWSAKGKGKRGDARVITYHFDRDRPIFLLLIYPKNAQDDMNSDQKRQVMQIMIEIKDEARKIR